MTEILKSFLERIGTKFTENWANIRDLQSWMLEEIYRKRKTFPFWRKKVRFSYVSWRRYYLRRHPEEKELNIAPNLTRFFYSKFDWLFRYYFDNMFLAFNVKNLKLLSVEGSIKPQSEIFFLYTYTFSKEEMEEFIQFKKRYNHPDHHYRIISYIFNSIIMVFSSLISEILKEKMSFNMICARIVEQTENQRYELEFLVHFQKLDTIFLKTFLNSLIYDFAELLPGIDPGLLSKLYLKKEKLYPMALKAYPKSNSHIVRVFYTLQRKSQILEHITPLLDITNFIGSRVEDSIFNTSQIVREILVEKAPTLIHYGTIEIYQEIFNYLNECASLFSTFQSNNRAAIFRQYQLFFFYGQYFLPLEVLTEPFQNFFYYPERFQDSLNSHLTGKSTIPKSFPILELFLFQGIRYEIDDVFDRVFHIIFQKNIHDMNENFFASLLKSINLKLHDKLHETLPPNTTFSQYFGEMVHVMCVILKNIAAKVFIRENPEMAVENFRDNLTRYTPEKIALRVLEMRIFKDIPLADNNWQDYYLSRNKSIVQKTFAKYYHIPDNYFFTEERLLKINMNYERGILKETPLLEDWLIDNIVIPFDNFYKKIKKNVGRKFEFNKIRLAIFAEISSGVIDPVEREKLEDYAAYLAELWIYRT